MTSAISPDADLTDRIIGLPVQVHRHLGPGLLETAFQRCLRHEMSQAAIPFEQQIRLPIRTHGIEIEPDYQADIIVRPWNSSVHGDPLDRRTTPRGIRRYKRFHGMDILPRPVRKPSPASWTGAAE